MAKGKKQELLEEILPKNQVNGEDISHQIPKNWIWTKFSSVCSLENGYAFKSDHYSDEGIPLIRISNIKDGQIDISNCVYIKETDIAEKFLIKKGDLLIAMSGATTGKNGVYLLDTPAYLNQRVGNIKLRDSKLVTEKFRNIYIMDKNQEILAKAYGGAQPNISGVLIGELKFPLPPHAEQQRIVDRIELLFDKLDRAKELVQNALDSFENRKTAILHKAFTGELTAKWREENGVSLNDWNRKKLKELCTINPKKISTKDINDNIEVTFVPMPSVSDVLGIIETPLIKTLGEVKTGYTNFCEGDVIFAKITPCMENGKSAIVGKLKNNIGFGSTEFHVLRCGEQLNNQYLYHLVRWNMFKDQAKGEMTGAVGQQRVPKSFLEEYTLNLPIIEEQKEIVSILNRILQSEQQAEELCNVLDKIDLMKKAILAKAFRGELGTNDPAEESAVELLKKILVQKE